LDFDDLPPHIQAAIKRRDAVTRPVHEAIDALDLTWEITGGNLGELDQALRTWEGDGWRNIHEDGAAQHRYHRQVLRLFHNFLSSALSAVEHAKGIVAELKGVAPDHLSDEFADRRDGLEGSAHYRLLDCLRDYAIHRGHHSTVLVLRGVQTELGDGGLAGSVCLDLKRFLGYLDIEAKRGSKKGIRETRRVAGALPEHPEIRGILEKYFEEVGDLLRWLRQALLDVNTAAYARPMAHWAAEAHPAGTSIKTK
jgi:hypothetical protein